MKRGKTCGGGCNANAGNFAFSAMRGKTYCSYNTSVGIYATAAMRGKKCGGCNLIYNTSAGNYAKAVISGKAYGGCNIQAREIVQLLPCAGKPLMASLQA